jgi:hypothetical protein
MIRYCLDGDKFELENVENREAKKKDESTREPLLVYVKRLTAARMGCCGNAKPARISYALPCFKYSWRRGKLSRDGDVSKRSDVSVLLVGRELLPDEVAAAAGTDELEDVGEVNGRVLSLDGSLALKFISADLFTGTGDETPTSKCCLC